MRIPLILRATVLLLPILEIVLLIVLGSKLGALPVIGLLLAAAVLGGLLLRRQGARLVREIERSLNAGRLPVAETFRAACVGVAGFLLIMPGVISDVVALALALPPVQRLIYEAIARRLRGEGRGGRGEGIIEADFEVVEEHGGEVVIEHRRDPPGKGEP